MAEFETVPAFQPLPGMVCTNSLRDRPEPLERNKRPPRYRDWQRPLSGCRLRGVADRSGVSSASDLVGRFGIVLLGPNHAVVDRLLLLLEQVLEDELTPSAAACVHQRATLVELSQLDGCEPELFG